MDGCIMDGCEELKMGTRPGKRMARRKGKIMRKGNRKRKRTGFEGGIR